MSQWREKKKKNKAALELSVEIKRFQSGNMMSSRERESSRFQHFFVIKGFQSGNSIRSRKMMHVSLFLLVALILF